MKELVILSGKGGTGKTSITASFAVLAGHSVLADCDVDASNLHLVLNPQVLQREEFSGGLRANINPELCIDCGTCQTLCRFAAIFHDGPPNAQHRQTFRVDPLACEGCGVCEWFCPAQAIEFGPAITGEVFISATRYGPLIFAQPRVAQGNSGKLAATVREKARHIAKRHALRMLYTDGAPGIGCPVIASITGADAVLIITEPTLSALHDLIRLAELTAHFRIPTLVCVNKWELNELLTQRIEEEARRRGLALAGRVRYSPAFTRAQIQGKAVVECEDDGCAAEVRALWQRTRQEVQDMTAKPAGGDGHAGRTYTR
jgi:MinD superfamily P-loop ATPase